MIESRSKMKGNSRVFKTSTCYTTENFPICARQSIALTCETAEL